MGVVGRGRAVERGGTFVRVFWKKGSRVCFGVSLCHRQVLDAHRALVQIWFASAASDLDQRRAQPCSCFPVPLCQLARFGSVLALNPAFRRIDMGATWLSRARYVVADLYSPTRATQHALLSRLAY